MLERRFAPPWFSTTLAGVVQLSSFVQSHGPGQKAPGRASALPQLRYGCRANFPKARFATSIRWSALKGFSIRS
jgi:hypothetical protein